MMLPLWDSVIVLCFVEAWSMESLVWNSIPNLGFTSKNGITKHVLYSIPIPMSATEC